MFQPSTIDMIFSVIGLCFAMIYVLLAMEIFQSNDFIENLRYVPIGLFFNNRILFQPYWTIDFISKNFPMIFDLHLLLNSLSLLCSVSMFTSIKSNKPHRGRDR